MSLRSKSASKPTRRQRKSTFIVRKEEKQRLEKELSKLRAKWVALHAQDHDEQIRQATLPGGSLPRLSPASATHAAVRDRHLAFSGLRSLLSAYVSKPHAVTLQEPIYLTAQPAARRAALLRRSVPNIRDWRRFLLERSRFLDLSRPHMATEWFENSDNGMTLVKFDVTPLRSISGSVRDVYDAIGFFAQNVEIFVSEQIGNLTVREDDEVEPLGDVPETSARVSQRRLMSTTDFGLTIDANVAVFRQYFAKGESEDLPEEHAIMCTQSVEWDELYPYVPEERVRHDLHSGFLVQQVPTANGQLITTLVRLSTITRHGTAGRHVVTEETEEPLRALAVQWGDLMLAAVNDHLRRVSIVSTTTPESVNSQSPASSASPTDECSFLSDVVHFFPDDFC